MTTPYLVLARKYRPQRFADLTGQEHVVRTLVNALKTGRVAHAFLFTGPRGCGKTTTARILARALNCERGPTPEPCGACGPCVDIAAGTDLDVQEIDAASNNGVDDVRALREAAKYLPARDRYKIYIVDEVHMLSGAAFNALLKTLEEPPGHIKFLLATTDPQKLPATILSRVQRHNIQLVPFGKIVARLREIAKAEGVAVEDGALSLVGRQAQGSMRDALSLLDQLFSAHDSAAGEITEREAAEILGALDRGVVSAIVAAVLGRDARAALEGIVRAYEAGADFKRLAEDLAAHARNLLLAALPQVRQDLPDHELRALGEEARARHPAQLARVFELLQRAQEEVAKAASPRQALEVALLRAVYLAPSGALPDLVARVEQLSARLAGNSAASTSNPPANANANAITTTTPTPTPTPNATPTTNATPSAVAPATPASLDQRWRALVDAVRAARKAAAAAVLEHAIPLEISDSAVVIGFRKGDGRAGILADRETRAAIEAAFERALGSKASLQMRELPEGPLTTPDAPASLAEERERARAARVRERIAQAREHPAVRAAVELLTGEIEDVKDLGEE